MVIFGKLAKLLICYKRYVLSHPGLHLAWYSTVVLLLAFPDYLAVADSTPNKPRRKKMGLGLQYARPYLGYLLDIAYWLLRMNHRMLHDTLRASRAPGRRARGG